jgi:hypothetical protein
MKREIIEAMVMPGGWHKPEKSRAGMDMPVPIRADTYKQLIEAVIKFRADNVIPIGDAKADVDEYICSNFPHMCHPEGAVSVEVYVDNKSNEIKTLTDQMLHWLDRSIENHSIENLEMRTEAMRRADICLGCRYNTKWNSGCGSCSEAVGRMSNILRLNNDVPRGDKLKACQILKHENRSAVWLKKEKIMRSNDVPNHCWAR